MPSTGYRQSVVRSQFAMNGMLRFSGAVERDPAIELWMTKDPGELGSKARQWFEVMRKCGDEFRELLHDGCPVACVGGLEPP